MEIDIFKRKQNSDALSGSAERVSRLDLKKFLYALCVFFATRPAILGGMMPFGIALFAAEYISSIPYTVGIMVLISAGLVSHDALVMVKYTAAAVLFTALVKRFPSLLKNPVRRGALMTVCILSASVMVLWGSRILIYDLLILAVEGTLVFGLTLLFANAKNVILTGQVNPHKVSEDLISVSVFAATLILGIGTGFSVWGINLSQVLCTCAALLFAYSGGAGAGAVSGIAIGLTAGIVDGNIAPVLGAFAISSMGAGFLAVYGKAACFLTFVIINSLITLYTGGSAEAIINLYGIFAAGVIFMLLPQKLAAKFSLGIARNMKASPSRTGNFLSHELSILSSSLSHIAKTFSHISEAGLFGSDSAAPVFFDRTVKAACTGCPRMQLCWKKEFNRTYTSLFVMLQVCEKNGCLTTSGLPSGLSEKCLSVSKLVNTFNNMYDIYKVDRLWESRIAEARATMVRQLAAISETIDKRANSLVGTVTFDSGAEAAITSALCSAGVPLRSISVACADNKIFADVECRESCSRYADTICSTVGNRLGIPMQIIYNSGSRMRLIPHGALGINTGSATASRESRSGDCFGITYTPDGKCILVLSDGMGSGEMAYMNSNAVVTLLCNMFCAGYDTHTAVNIINSVLVLKSTDTSFATLDILVLDPDLCSAGFIKSGASSSYFKYDDKVQVISASGLPAGVTPRVDIEKATRSLHPTNCIVMITDGVADSDPSGDKWIVEIIGNYEGDNPHELAQQIIDEAGNRQGDDIKDDMTVLVAFVNKNSQTG